MMGNFGYGYSGFSWIGMLVGLVIAIGFIVGLAILAVWFIRHMGGNAQTTAQHPTGISAKDMAQIRYAKGEISRDEYQRILSDLER